MLNSAQQHLVKLEWMMARQARRTERTLALVLGMKEMARIRKEQIQASIGKR